MAGDFLGEKLHLARLFQGFSQQELGEKVEVTKQFVQLAESGKKSPGEELEKALAQALGVNTDFFYLDLPISVTEDKCHFRKLRTTTATFKMQAMSHGRLFSSVINYLDDVVSFPDFNFPQDDKKNWDVEDIEVSAEASRKRWGLGIDTPIKNMVRVLENAGAIVTTFSEISEKIDAFSMDLKRPIVIRNTKKESACRARFDLAHECGHLVMHSGELTGDLITENAAHRFASALLLPRVAFLKEFSFLKSSAQINWRKLYKLKIRWKVSVSAIVHRAADLGLIDALRYRKANIFLRKTGQTRNERFDDQVEFEEPEVLNNAIDLLEMEEKEFFPLFLRKIGVRQKFLEKVLGRNFSFKIKELSDSTHGNLILYPQR